MILVLFVLGLMVSGVFAENHSSSVINLRTVQWEGMVILALLAVYGMLGIAFMFSRLFALPELEGWAKNEFYQVNAMLILVLLVFVVLNAENRVFESFGYDPDPNNPNSAIKFGSEYLGEVRLYLLPVFASTFVSNTIFNSVLSVSNLKIGEVLDFKNATEHLVDSISDLLGIAAAGLGASLSLTVFQQWFLDFVKDTAFTLFLPLGILMRSLPFSRKVGSILIALAIAFYLVYPLTFLMDQKIVDHILNQKLKQKGQSCQECWKNLAEIRITALEGIPLSKAAFDRVFEKEGSTDSVPKGLFDKVYELGGAGLSAATAVVAFLVKSPLILVREAAFAFVTFTMLAILNVVITLGTARSIAQLMGSDVSFGDLIGML